VRRQLAEAEAVAGVDLGFNKGSGDDDGGQDDGEDDGCGGDGEDEQ